MKLYQVVGKDAFRRRRRVLYTAMGVAFGVAVVIALLTIARAGEEKIYSELDKYGANLMVTPAVQDLDLQLGDLTMGNLSIGEHYIDQDKLPQIRQIADDAIREELGIEDEGDISTIAPKLYTNVTINDTNVTVAGIDVQQEVVINSWWELSDGTYPHEGNEALLGARSSQVLDLDVGDEFIVEETSMVVTGVLGETGANADYQVFIPLASAQQMLAKDGLVSSIDIRALCTGCPVEIIADSINENIAGVRAVAVKQIAKAEMNLMRKVNDFLLALAGITLVIGMFGVINTMMSSVHERVKDIGIMKAIGASPNQIVRLFLYEALIVGIIGGIIGYVAGTLLSYLVGPAIFEGIAINYVIGYLGPALGLAVFVSVFASAYPAFRASKIKVAESIRSM